MTPLQLAKAWIESEKPNQEEIQQSVDNLCHQLARPPAGISETELHLAIAHLMFAIGKDPADLVLPDKPAKAELDLSPLGEPANSEASLLTSAERRERFLKLKVDIAAMLAPF
ncbi:hypothetical protein [Pseudomonas violetae]|uniref:Uncharacterized protein n=1 Tax=Pseudomonas violetae TaxID=2915813 RepID=A0ABT0ESE3_9PSED|nr:hypothetical protein [Pseudomonas violetae]MCK1788646.1 hypothetical protein [Pseudomonas violetae]